MAHPLGLLLNAAFPPLPARGRPYRLPSPYRSWLQACGHRLLQALVVLCLLWAFHAPASAAACSITMTADANAATTGTVYNFTLADNTACDADDFGIADSSVGFANTDLSERGGPLYTTGGGTLYAYNLPGGTTALRYVAPSGGMSGPDSGTFYTSTNGTSWTPSGTVTIYPFVTLASISPSSGSTAGGPAVTITGTNLGGVTSVTFGGTAGTSITANSATSVTVTPPAHAAGAVNVVVAASSGTAVKPNGYTYVASAPTVTSVSPSSGTAGGGTPVTITGTNLTGATSVTFGGTAGSITANSATSITVTSPPHAAGAFDVVVTTPGGSSATSANSKYTYTPLPTLSIDNVSKAEGNTGTSTMTFTVTLSAASASAVTVAYATSNGTATAGSDYTATGGTLTFAPGVTSQTINVDIVGDTVVEPNETFTVTLSSPSGATLGTPSGTGTIQNDDVAAPTVSNVSPSSGPLGGGTTVVITGTNLTGATAVKFGATNATSFTVNSATQITATSPANAAGVVDITVTTTAGGTSATSAADQYTYVAPPVASAVSATVAYGSSSNTIPLNITGSATSVAVSTGASHGTATAVGTTISYTPTVGYAGADTFTYTATNAEGTSSPATVTITVSAPTIIYAPSSPSSTTVGMAYSHSLAGASGGASPYTYAITSGSLPAGMTLASSGTLSGTPTAGGTFNFTVQARDSSTGTGPFTASRALSLTVNAPTISVGPVSLPNATAGTSYPTQTMSASGGIASYSYAVTAGSLPAGLSLNTGTGVISGTPTGSGNYNFTITATDSSTGSGPYTGSRAYTVTIGAPAITISPNTLQTPVYNVAYSQTLSASGGSGSYTYALTGGALPAGLSLNTSNGVISGTPTASGSYNFTITATETPSGASASQPYSGTIAAPTITMTPASLSGATTGVPYSQTLSANGGVAPYTYAVTSGTLPAWLSLNTSNGVISGTPTASGSYSFTVTATDKNHATGAQSYTLAVTNQAPVANLVNATVAANSSSNNIPLNITGGTATSVAVASAASHGVATASGTTISYTPTAGFSGNDIFTYTATGLGGTSSPGTVNITVSAPTLAISPPSVPAATLNTAYPPLALSASGGTAPYSYAVTAGGLPAGLSLNTATGGISGTPTAIATYNFTITATDANGATGSRAYSLDVQAQAVVVPPSNETVVAGQTASVDLTRGATGGPFTSATLLSVAPQQAGSVHIVAPSTLSFTPAASYSGSAVVSFRLLATSGAQGNGFLTFTVTAAAPTASPITFNTAANQPVTINAIANATGAPFIGGPSISTQPASGAVVVQGMNLVYTPAASTQGAISFAYTLANASGTSAPIAVTVQVAARPDPTANADVRGLNTAQQQTTVRMAATQLVNFTHRMEQLRNPHRQAFHNGLQLAMPRAGNNSIRNCQNVPSMLGQQDCIARQGMDSRASLATSGNRASWGAQGGTPPSPYGLTAEQAYASRLDSEDASASATLGGVQRNLAQRAVALGAGSPARTSRVNADEPLPEPGSTERPRLAYWTAGMLDWGFADASKGEDDGLRFTTSGVTMGFDYLVNAQWTVGMGMGFAYDRTKIGSEGSRNHSKGVSTALYGSWNPAPAYFVDGVLGYSRLRFDSRRWVADAGEFAQGARDGTQWFASVAAGYEWRTQQMMLSPYGRLQWARSTLDAYTETGASWHALQFGAQRITSSSASLGLRGETSHDTRWGQLLPFGRLELQHDFDDQSAVRIAYADLSGGEGYAISSNPIGRNRVQIGFGSRLQSRMGTFAAELQFTRSNTSFQRGLRLSYTTRY